MSRFADLEAFVAVVETGSFTAAAERLEGDKSAISRRISALEERLGVQLLRRTTRSLNLTDSGAGFYQRASQVLSDLEEAESAVAQEHGELRGRLRLSLPLSFSVRHMGTPIAEFNAQHPQVEFDLDLSDRKVDLLQDGMDLALRIGRLEDSSLIARRLFDARAVVCASPDYIAEHGAPESPEDLINHRCLAYSLLEDPDHWTWIDDDGNRQKVRVGVSMMANSGDILSQAAAAGQGIVLQPTFIAHEFICDGRLVPLLRDYKLPESAAYAVYPPTRHLSYRVRAFIDYLVDYFSGECYWDKECE